ncbi:FAD-dependent monooxygenase [Streptomyces sp. SID13031]|uniref:FAD-dependent oxidoreductase n=1 Tax=Streptomyces sp. SID13031 TaxID=2706046 RepID=UPI0013C7249B|nr:FAD-dependent monooxygenase [Streptomyces sp. SID13031]NEA35809.1 hydroxylase [Streptomyces sp. SID13031]
MTESAVAVFDRLYRAGVPERPVVLFDRACVVGGSIAGLLAARVLADHAREVVIVERDQTEPAAQPRTGVPQDRHGHVLLPGGLSQIERWLPGIAAEAEALGGYLAGPDQQVVYHDGREQALASGEAAMLLGTRPFLEARIRSRVLALPNVSTVSGQATGLAYDVGVSGVRCGDELVSAAFVVDAMGRASKLSAWLEKDGYERPRMRRVQTGINYVTALFERAESSWEQEIACVLERFTAQSMPFELTVAHLSVIEDDQWLVMLMAYGDHPAAKSIESFRSTCAELPPVFAKAAGGAVTRGIQTYHQADSRRRDFTGLSRFPARLVAMGDAVASFNPIYGQGLSSAAFHAACLSEYLVGEPDLEVPAAGFFALQEVVVDAAWAISAGGDAARQDLITGAEVPEDVRRQRWAMSQIIKATLVDKTVAAAFAAVTRMQAHPATLRTPEMLERALAANQR